jgi:ketosteroid isomerase-like protein
MDHRNFFDAMFAKVDARDADQFADCFTEDGTFRFGNLPPVHGRSEIRDFISGFFDSIGGISHRFENCWSIGEEQAFCSGEVTYVRKDGSELTVPWATVSRFETGRLSEYLAYVDPSQLFAPAEAANV